MICRTKDVNRGTKIKMEPIGKLRAHRGGDIGPWNWIWSLHSLWWRRMGLTSFLVPLAVRVFPPLILLF